MRNNWMPSQNAWMNQYDMRSHNVLPARNNSENQNHSYELVNHKEMRNPNLVMNNYEKANPDLMMNYNDKRSPNEQHANTNKIMNLSNEIPAINNNEVVKEKMTR